MPFFIHSQKILNMKNLSLIALFIGSFAFGQTFPKLSPKSALQQKVGLCNIDIEYSRPSVRERKIFGDVVPYEDVWRLGANECTKISIDQPLIFDEKELDTGKYAIFAIPKEDGNWEIIFNSDHKQWGSLSYDEKKNVLTTEAKAVSGDCYFSETFTISIINVSNYGASFIFNWENTKVELPFKVDTDTHVSSLISQSIEAGKDLEKVHYRAANYFLVNKNDTGLAMDHIEKSIALERGYYNVFLKAQILAEEGNMDDAKRLGEEAKKLALAEEKKGWADYMQEKMDEWGK